jgi:hypothetical protein
MEQMMSKDFDKKSLIELYKGSDENVEERAEQIFDRLVGGVEKLESKVSKLPQGPLPKNQFTVDFEYIIKAIENGDDVDVFIENEEYHVNVNGITFNLSKILKNMDGRQVMLNEDSDGNELTKLEIQAITTYTGELYKALNGLMRAEQPNDDNYLSVKSIPNYLAMAGHLLSGLNRLPDIEINYAFRVQNAFLDKEIQESINDPKKVVIMSGFVSSSIGSAIWSGGNRIVMFYNIRGKDIRPYSSFGENEFLMPPMQVKFEGMQAGKDQDGRAMIFYVARPVNTVAGLTNEQKKVGKPVETPEEKKAKIEAMVIKINEIRDLYKQQTAKEKLSFFNKREIKAIIQETDKVFNDPYLSIDYKERTILKGLDSLQKIMQKSNISKPILHEFSRSKSLLNGDAVTKKLLEQIKDSPYDAIESMFKQGVFEHFKLAYLSASKDERSNLRAELKEEFLQLGEKHKVHLSDYQNNISILVEGKIIDPDRFEEEKESYQKQNLQSHDKGKGKDKGKEREKGAYKRRE